MTEVIKYCMEEQCADQAATKGYCRLHYIKNWKYLKMQKKLKSEGKLNEYVQRMVNKYPEEHIKVIREDLDSSKDLTELLDEYDPEKITGSDIDEETEELIAEIKKSIK
jgi:hypothetical protein